MKPPKSAKRPPKADHENWKARCLDAEGKLAALRRGKDLVEIDLTKVLENSLAGELYRRIDELERQLADARNETAKWRQRHDAAVAARAAAGRDRTPETPPLKPLHVAFAEAHMRDAADHVAKAMKYMAEKST